ncbi:MAG: 16S rRNA (adenine(1518)-N(6)/adenine(1519)-N(6))-dimethyltransferase RsmA [Pseudomonadota bacterium]|nr:16S rRNA (adenine(1518)-N(6)/adenine(1519)-N(6))-dimethyltransferase RsmA [Pseudomonadota bacterium]
MLPENFHSKKKFGQNFLKDKEVVSKIINSVKSCNNQFSLEIGPGFGILTENLIKFSEQVLAIEIDNQLVKLLEKKFRSTNNLTLLNQDVLTFDFNSIKQNKCKWVLVGNLPYNLATQIILKSLETPSHFEKIVVMVQYEVAKRIIASPRTKSYGRLSINIQRKADVYLQQIVPPDCFFPVPAVNSAVLEITPKHIVRNSKLDITLDKITKMAFSKRRKTVLNALKPVFVENDFKKYDIDPQARPEDLSIRQYESLAKKLV